MKKYKALAIVLSCVCGLFPALTVLCYVGGILPAGYKDLVMLMLICISVVWVSVCFTFIHFFVWLVFMDKKDNAF